MIYTVFFIERAWGKIAKMERAINRKQKVGLKQNCEMEINWKYVIQSIFVQICLVPIFYTIIKNLKFKFNCKRR